MKYEKITHLDLFSGIGGFALCKGPHSLDTVQKAFKSLSNQRLVDSYGGLKEVYIIGGGGMCGFNFGFLTGCLYYQRGYKGKIERLMANPQTK